MFQDRELLPDRELAQKSFSHVDSENLACTRIAAETDRGGQRGVNGKKGVDPPSLETLTVFAFGVQTLCFPLFRNPGVIPGPSSDRAPL